MGGNTERDDVQPHIHHTVDRRKTYVSNSMERLGTIGAGRPRAVPGAFNNGFDSFIRTIPKYNQSMNMVFREKLADGIIYSQ
jgi:hypothetical protein